MLCWLACHLCVLWDAQIFIRIIRRRRWIFVRSLGRRRVWRAFIPVMFDRLFDDYLLVGVVEIFLIWKNYQVGSPFFFLSRFSCHLCVPWHVQVFIRIIRRIIRWRRWRTVGCRWVCVGLNIFWPLLISWMVSPAKCCNASFFNVVLLGPLDGTNMMRIVGAILTLTLGRLQMGRAMSIFMPMARLISFSLCDCVIVVC